MSRERAGQAWARERMSQYLRRIEAVDELDDESRCPGWHDGPCDWWAACTGMSLGIVEREAAGAAHPWRRWSA